MYLSKYKVLSAEKVNSTFVIEIEKYRIIVPTHFCNILPVPGETVYALFDVGDPTFLGLRSIYIGGRLYSILDLDLKIEHLLQQAGVSTTAILDAADSIKKFIDAEKDDLLARGAICQEMAAICFQVSELCNVLEEMSA